MLIPMILKRLATFLICALCLLPPTLTWAQSNTPLNKAAVTQQAEHYLNALGTIKARFVQTTHDGAQLVGTFYLDRPGKLRFQYDPPIKDFVVADGLFIYFYDGELGEQTNAPIGSTMADFLLRDNIKLSGDIHVENIKRGGGYLQMELSQAEDRGAGRLMLAFDEKPFKLRKWRIVDPQGLITEVELFYMKNNIDLDDSLFSYRDPNHGKTQRLNE